MRPTLFTIISAGGIGLFIAGCMAPVQHVVPVPPGMPKDICLEDNPSVMGSVHEVLRTALEEKGYSVKVLPRSSDTSGCPATVTYVAHFGWDLAVYLQSADIRVRTESGLIGSAQYAISGGSFKKFGTAESKLRELVDQLFP